MFSIKVTGIVLGCTFLIITSSLFFINNYMKKGNIKKISTNTPDLSPTNNNNDDKNKNKNNNIKNKEEVIDPGEESDETPETPGTPDSDTEKPVKQKED
jgi:ABC-type lipoprotein release transport system permease subunit